MAKKTFSPAEFCEAYPNFDLLALEMPDATVSWHDFLRSKGLRDCQDKLFQFLAFETGEDSLVEPLSAILRRIDIAQKDVAAVSDAIRNKLS